MDLVTYALLKKRKDADSSSLSRQIVTSLPTEDINPNTIYMIQKEPLDENNIYEEYMYIEDKWELLGSSTQLQSDWNISDNSSAAYIQNRPFYEDIKLVIDHPDCLTAEEVGVTSHAWSVSQRVILLASNIELQSGDLINLYGFKNIDYYNSTYNASLDITEQNFPGFSDLPTNSYYFINFYALHQSNNTGYKGYFKDGDFIIPDGETFLETGECEIYNSDSGTCNFFYYNKNLYFVNNYYMSSIEDRTQEMYWDDLDQAMVYPVIGFNMIGTDFAGIKVEITNIKKLDPKFYEGDNDKTTIISGALDGFQIGEKATAEGSDIIATGSRSHAEGSGGIFSDTSGIYPNYYIFNKNQDSGDWITTDSRANFYNGIPINIFSYNNYYGNIMINELLYSNLSGNIYNATLQLNNTNIYSELEDAGITSCLVVFTTGATGDYSHSEGMNSMSYGGYSHAEGYGTIAYGSSSHAEGLLNMAIGSYSHVEGGGTRTRSIGHGDQTTYYGSYAIGTSSHAEGLQTTALGKQSHAEGDGGSNNGRDIILSDKAYNSSTRRYSYSSNLGFAPQIGAYLVDLNSTLQVKIVDVDTNNKIITEQSIDTGVVLKYFETGAFGEQSHSEGYCTRASGQTSHAEGQNTKAEQQSSHAEGYQTAAGGLAAHSEGYNTKASAAYAHAEGESTEALGPGSHAEGLGTKVYYGYQHAFGKFNTLDLSGSGNNQGVYVEIVGKGTDDSHRSNARTLDWSGNEWLAGKLTVGVAPANDMDVATKKYVDDLVGNVEDVLEALL